MAPTTFNDDLLETAAVHEAGHAVMRWLAGLPLTNLTARSDGSGFCAGTGRRTNIEPSVRLQLTLAGIVAESGYGLAGAIDWKASSHDCDDIDDITEARRLLSQFRHLRVSANAKEQPILLPWDRALQRVFTEVCDLLLPHHGLVDRIAERLTDERRLTARTVAALCREHHKRESQNERL